MNSTAKIKRQRKPLSPEQKHSREKKAYEQGMRRLFAQFKFVRIPVDGKEFNFLGRTGEIDDIFVYENIVVIVEYTVGKPSSEHLLKKKPLYDNMLDNQEAFAEFAKSNFAGLKSAIGEMYTNNAIIFKYIYASKRDPSPELKSINPRISFLSGSSAKYFAALAKTIEASGRIEFAKFLGLEYESIGEATLSASQRPISYDGFLLPEGNSSYPKNFKIVSFYADPQTLMEKCYVLRRDGWRDEEHLYQRILVPKKIRQMRKYLIDEGRVFVNNIIATLPPETKLNELDNHGKNLAADQLGRVQPIQILYQERPQSTCFVSPDLQQCSYI